MAVRYNLWIVHILLLALNAGWLVTQLSNVQPEHSGTRLEHLQRNYVAAEGNRKETSSDVHNEKRDHVENTYYGPSKSHDEEYVRKWNFNWDGRQPQPQHKLASQSQVPKQWRFLYLVRHGQYHRDVDMGDPRLGHLTQLGQHQAHLAGQRLKDLNITFHRFVASSSIRASGTADIIHQYLPSVHLEKDPLLTEGWPRFPEPAQPLWDPKDPQYSKDHDRMSETFEKYMYRALPTQHMDSNELIVAHGNVISYFVLRALQMPIERWLKVSVYQGSITMLILFPDGHVDLRILGDVGHLPKRQWTG